MNRDTRFLYLTTGRKTGLARKIEIWFVESDGRVYILAEHGLKAQWVQNILVNPRVRVRIGDQQWDGSARVLDPEQDAEAYLKARQLAREKFIVPVDTAPRHERNRGHCLLLPDG